jgi:hypothetical protein
MGNGRPIQSNRPTDAGASGPDERARIHARLQSLDAPVRDDTTRRIGSSRETRSPAYDGSLAHPGHSGHAQSTSIETRAFLLTADGGVLAELPCSEDAGVVVLGRGQAADIKVNDPYAHRQHAEIRWDAGKNVHMIAHGGGENGTYVNRHRVRLPLMLVGGEQIRIGKTRLIYKVRR